ncbi:hypothetical protein RHGRI_007287 [Rhododendron griersonianum]|uniref:MADS-box domain-containing protein n=1 Tax=Rhododendron griersonianum TaxID=479676 RepID=A0AAV6KXV9_9ERIC|nr:hypothetical protein RHGRI_007287 [Rhododendron griersonianum]
MKKASELSVLCNVDIGLFIFSGRGRLHKFFGGDREAGCVCVRKQMFGRYFVAPQGNRVLIGLEELPEKLAGGVLLPKAAVKFERYLMGEVSKNTISTSAAVKLI